MSKKENSAFSHFFKEDAEIIRDIVQGGSGQGVTKKVGASKKEVLPKISRSKEVTEEDQKTEWRKLRSFFRNGNNEEGLPHGLSPALLAPLYTRTMVGQDFPFWVADENFTGEGEYCGSLHDILENRLYQIGPEKDDAHILKENIERILHIANTHLADHKPQLFQPAIHQILQDLDKELDVSGDEAVPFKNDLQHLKSSLPETGVLLPYTSNTSLQLLEAAIAASLGQSRKSLLEDIESLTGRLRDMLRVEEEKGPEQKKPGKLHDSFEFADSMVDFDELSAILPDAGTEIMSEERFQRISGVVNDLEKANGILEHQCFLFVDEFLNRSKDEDLEVLLGTSDITVYKKGEGCNALVASFEEHIAEWTRFFAAKRIGDLEFNNSYLPEIHDEFFDHFNWQSFSIEELNNCPYFILIADDVRLFENEFSKLSAMLTSNIPVKIVAVKRDESVDGEKISPAKNASGWHANTELGALMLSYKNIYIAQSSAITPKYLFSRFKEGLTVFAPAFFYLLNIDRKLHADSYLWTSACVESRSFPGFTFRGLLGTSWGARFDIQNNPQPDQPWPLHTLKIINSDGGHSEMTLPFSFADWAVLNQSYSHHFRLVPASFWNDELIPLTDYMEATLDDNIGKVPFIWMMDEDNELHKVAVSWPMVIATQERLDFWRFLEENSGINNYHVSRAVEASRLKIQEEHQLEIEALKAEQELSIQKIREEEAGNVMENLTSALLNLDTANIFTTAPPAAKPKQSDHPETQSESQAMEMDTEQPAVETEEEIELSVEPYIDTALCTACNECTELNGQMFKYNADKLAYIADPKAGTYSDLVEAAEICPVSIIHPGSPLNSDEVGLDDLIERAKKYN